MDTTNGTPERRSISPAYLYENNAPEQLAFWARRLQYFRFVRDPGGANGGGDSLEVLFRVPTPELMLQILTGIGVPLIPITPADEFMQPGRSYTGAEYAKLVDPIACLPTYRQPKKTYVHSIPVMAWTYSTRDHSQHGLNLSVLEHDSPWTITEAEFRGAETLEPYLAPFAAHLIDPPKDTDHCICPKFYPELWQAPQTAPPEPIA